MANNEFRKELQREISKLHVLGEQQNFSSMERMEKIESSVEEIAKAMTSLSDDSAAWRLEATGGSLNFGTNSHDHMRLAQIDFPLFNSTDLLNWISIADQYFAYCNTSEHGKVLIAFVNMEGDVIPWFQLMNRTNQITSWVALSKAVELQFGPTEYDNPRAQLFKLVQTSSVQEYYTRFMVLANRIEGVTADALLDCFFSGLKDEI